MNEIDRLLHDDLMERMRRSREARTSPDATTTFRMDPERARELFEAGKRESDMEHALAELNVRIETLHDSVDTLATSVAPLVKAHSDRQAVRAWLKGHWGTVAAVVALAGALLAMAANLDKILGEAPIADADDDAVVEDGEPDGLAGPGF